MSRPSAVGERFSKVFQRVLAIGFGSSVLLAGPAFAAPGGEVDSTFGSNGRVVITLANQSVGWTVAQQADGKLLIAGPTSGAGTGADFAIIRLNANGTLDNTFGAGGIVTIDFATFDDIASNIVVQPADGKIIVAGYADTGLVNIEYDLALVRLNADGSPDATFGANGNGRVTSDVGGFDDYIAGMVLVGNQIVVAGSTDTNGDYDAVFAAFDTNGALDPSFGTGGVTVVGVPASHEQPFWLTRQADGKLIACGLSGPTPYNATNGRMLAARVDANGSVDAGFGTNGTATVATGTTLGTAASCVAMPDGTTVLAGFDGNPGSADLSLARLTSAGALDMTFGTNGLASPDLGGTEIIQTIILLSDGKLGVTGLTADVSDNLPSDMFLARFETNGSLDPSFGNNGVTLLDFGSGNQQSNADGLGLIQQADGKLVAVGTNGTAAGIDGFAIGRVDPAGAGSPGIAGFLEIGATVTEGTANVTLTVRRTGGGTGAISVDYTTVAGTAMATGDFTATNGTLNWASGDMTTKPIAIPITNDTTAESAENFTITLSVPAGGGGGVALATTTLSVTINNDDAAPPPSGGGGGGGGGGGAVGIELLALLALVNAFALRRRRGRGTALNS